MVDIPAKPEPTLSDAVERCKLLIAAGKDYGDLGERDAQAIARVLAALPQSADFVEELQSHEDDMNETRREIRQRLLGTGSKPLLDAYYKALTLSEHEAYRRALVRVLLPVQP